MTDNGHHLQQPSQPTKPRFKIQGDIGGQIIAIAKRLRPCCEEYNIVTIVSGSALQEQGVFEIKHNGLIQPVEIAGMYPVPGVALRNINHISKLRKFYYANGIIGVHDYLIQFPNYEATMKGQYPALWQSGTYIGVKEGTQMPVDPVWLQQMDAVQKMHTQIQSQ